MGTTYHIRAYAKNSAGTSYGADVVVKMPSVPTFSTSAYYHKGVYSSSYNCYSIYATFKVNVDEGMVVTSAGYYACWSSTGLSDTSTIATYGNSYAHNKHVTCSLTTDGSYSGTYDYTTPYGDYVYKWVRPYIVTNLGTFWASGATQAYSY